MCRSVHTLFEALHAHLAIISAFDPPYAKLYTVSTIVLLRRIVLSQYSKRTQDHFWQGTTEMTAQEVQMLWPPISLTGSSTAFWTTWILSHIRCLAGYTGCSKRNMAASSIIPGYFQADEEAELAVNSRSISACGSTAPGSRHQRAVYGMNTCSGHPPATSNGDASISHVLETALSEHDMDTDRPAMAPGSQPRDLVPGVSFCEEVRRRVKKMQQELQAREHTVASLNMQIKSLQHAHRHGSFFAQTMHECLERL